MPLFERERVGPSREVINRLNQHNRRLRILEQRHGGLVDQIESLNKTLTDGFKEIKGSLNKINQQIAKINSDLETKRKELELMKKELRNKAEQREVEKLNKYIDLVDPLRQEFVKKEEVKKLLREMIK